MSREKFQKKKISLCHKQETQGILLVPHPQMISSNVTEKSSRPEAYPLMREIADKFHGKYIVR